MLLFFITPPNLPLMSRWPTSQLGLTLMGGIRPLTSILSQCSDRDKPRGEGKLEYKYGCKYTRDPEINSGRQIEKNPSCLPLPKGEIVCLKFYPLWISLTRIVLLWYSIFVSWKQLRLFDGLEVPQGISFAFYLAISLAKQINSRIFWMS